MLLLKTETALGDSKISVMNLFNNEELIKKTGIDHVYESSTSTVSLASLACNNIERYIDKNLVKLCILVTQTPDDYLPANSITLANKIGLPSNCLTMDISQGCSGFVQALCLVDKLSSFYNNILLVTADRYRSKLNKIDRSTNAVFSDGASATICQYDANYGIIYETHLTDGSKRNLLFQSVTTDENGGYLHMSGAEVWMFTRIKVVPQILEAIDYCKNNNLNIKGIYIHQASRVVVDGIKSLLKGSENKVYENYSLYGNTVSSSIPFLLKDYPLDCEDGRSVNIFAGFGVGLTSSVIIYGKKNG
jgi:3-oxoacyl-[acyl-carrier-protein] synthase-3